MYQLNQKIVALTEELKISASETTPQTVKEGFTQPNTKTRFSKINRQFKTDADRLNAAMTQLDADADNASQFLLQSRIKFGVALAIGLLLAYFAYRFLTADELPTTIATELGATDSSLESSTSEVDFDSVQ